MRTLWAFLIVVTADPAIAQAPDVAGAPPARASLAGEVIATYGSADPGFFNYATYAYDPLRNVRVVLDAALQPLPHVAVLAQLRTDGLSHARLAALYVRLRPWRTRRIDVQAGRVPTAFGLFGRSGYGSESPLIGRPVAYAYLLSLRRDAVAGAATDLVRMRGRGWLSSLPRGNAAAARGLPIVDTDTWDTGVQVRAAAARIEWTGAITNGSLGSPRLGDDNDDKALSTRATVRLHPGVVVGASAARGAYLSRSVDAVLGPGDATSRLRQQAAGLDVDLSSGRWLARGEVLVSRWQLPAFDDGTPAHPHVTAVATWGEGRLRLLPGLDAGLRLEHVHFDDIDSAAGPTPWEAAVSRAEAGLAFTPMRHLRLKVAVQRNRRPDGGRVRHDTLLGAQAAVWF